MSTAPRHSEPLTPAGIRNLAEGDEIEIVLRRRVSTVGLGYPAVPGVAVLGARRSLDSIADVAGGNPEHLKVYAVRKPWRPGDVVVVRFNGPASQPYTYVRGVRDWPGDRVPMTDAEVDRHVATGQAVHVLRDGRPV